MNQAADAQSRRLRARLSAAPVLSDPDGAAARLAEVAPAWPAGFLDAPLRALLLGLADHSPFLWQLVARAPERLAALVEAEPEAALARAGLPRDAGPADDLGIEVAGILLGPRRQDGVHIAGRMHAHQLLARRTGRFLPRQHREALRLQRLQHVVRRERGHQHLGGAQHVPGLPAEPPPGAASKLAVRSVKTLVASFERTVWIALPA